MRRLLPLLLLLGATPGDEREQLGQAKREAAAANARAEQLTAAAARESDAAARARDKERALGTRVAAAAAEVRAAEARVALVGRAQAMERDRVAAAQAPVARLLAALTGLARRPTIAAVAQPGSVDDLIHVRAVLGTALPVVRGRSAGVRAELAATRRLQADAELAATALRTRRADLERRRIALAQLEARHRGQSRLFGESALAESDRALALGEQARDLVDRMAEQGQGEATAADLQMLPGPIPRPLGPGVVAPAGIAGVYHLPVAGTLITGLGEVSGAGVRARGLTFAVARAAPVRAPAGGVVRYAGRFRGYDSIVVIDHGDGWSTLLTGLGRLEIRAGQGVTAGQLLGRAGPTQSPQITVELRRRGRPADIAALL